MIRCGFALPDLLFTSGLTIALLGLILPGVQKFREEESRTKCTDNLRKLGTASANYSATHRSILPRDQVGTPKWSWNVELLPYIGQESLARDFNLGRDWNVGDNRKAVTTCVPLFQCPGTPRKYRTVLTADPETGANFTAAPTDYVGSAGAYYQNNDQANLYPGAMHHRKITHRIRLSDIQDGAAYTLFVVEMADKPNVWQARTLAEDRSTKVQTQALNGQWAAPNWNHLRSYTSDGKQQFGSCAVNCSNGASIYGFHPNGANGLFVDGTVRFLRTGLSQEMLIALVSIDGGEVLSPNDF